MSECSHNCSTCGENCSSRTQDKKSFLEALAPESSVKKVIGVVSGKGGVGKSLGYFHAGSKHEPERKTYSNSGCRYYRSVYSYGIWRSP